VVRALRSSDLACITYYQRIAVFLVGAIIYTSQVPEKWRPGCFDYAALAITPWYFVVLGGILFHYIAVISSFNDAISRAIEVGRCKT
jgi:predicted membrane channel-forming protein YqfA (hemolysin III family)